MTQSRPATQNGDIQILFISYSTSSIAFCCWVVPSERSFL
jgi:hypothetical protein